MSPEQNDELLPDTAAATTQGQVGESDTQVPPLVMAVPRADLFAIQGFETRVSLQVLESINEDHWFAQSDTIASDINAKELRCGLIIHNSVGEYLVHEDGVAVHTSSISPLVNNLGTGLKALREMGRIAANHLTDQAVIDIQLSGYFNDDHLEEARPYFLLVYVVRVRDDVALPSPLLWCPASELADQALDVVSSIIVSSWE